MIKFITLHADGKPMRYSANHIVLYCDGRSGGSNLILSVTVGAASAEHVDECAEKIDTLLGVTSDPASTLNAAANAAMTAEFPNRHFCGCGHVDPDAAREGIADAIRSLGTIAKAEG